MEISATAARADGPALSAILAPQPSLRARRRRALVPLAVGAGAVCLLILPPLYAFAVFGDDLGSALQPVVVAHVAMICAANLVVAIGGLRSRGRLDQRLASLLRLALFAHGSLALAILGLRLFYSVSLMALGVAGSLTLGAIAIYARGRIVRPRIGILGPWHPIHGDPHLDCVRLEPASQTLDDLDLVLLTFGVHGAQWGQSLIRKALLRGLRVRHVAEFLEEVRGACDLAHFEVDQISGEGLAGYRRGKRVLDLALVLLSLPLALPVLVLAALGVLLTMGRPVFYLQSRIGLGGRVFRMIKLRTMRHGADVAESRATAPGDERVTPFGRILRRLRADELPQLLNVLRGDMSVIGPRPEWAPLAQAFERQEPKYALRHLVRPGITGWAQVRAGPAADLAETRIKLAYDLFYLKYMSFTLDLQILWRTSWTLLAGGGAR